MNGSHYVGIPFGCMPPVIFPLGHKPTRKEIKVVFSTVAGPFTLDSAKVHCLSVRGFFVVNPKPLKGGG